MENTRFLKITVIVLLLVNIGTLVFMWSNRQHRDRPAPPPAGGPGGAFAYLTNELQLTDPQKEKLETLRARHRSEADKLDRISGPMHHRFFDLLGKGDSAAVDKMADSLAWCQKQRELITFRHFADIRELCNAEQRKKFDAVINDALRMMARPPGRPGGPEGPRHNPPGPPPGDLQEPPPPRE